MGDQLKKILMLLLLTMCLIYPNFTYIETINGMGDDYDPEDYEEDEIISEFSKPIDIAIHEDIIYILDEDDNVINKMKDNEVERTYGGSDINMPYCLNINNDQWYACDGDDEWILKYDFSPEWDRIGNNWEPKMKPTSVQLYHGLLYVSETYYNEIRTYDITENRIVDRFGKEGIYNVEFKKPNDLVVWNDKIYIADTGNDRVQVINLNGTFITNIGLGYGNYSINNPLSIALNDDGYLFVVEENNIISVFDPNGYPIEQFGEEGDGDYQFDEAISITTNEDKIYIVDMDNKRVQVYTFEDDRDNPELENKINTIGNEVELMNKLIDSATGLGLNFDTPAKKYYINAQTNYENKKYGIAESNINFAEQWLEDNTDIIKSEIEATLKLKINEMKLQISHYATAGIDTSQMASLIINAEIAIKDKSYYEAITNYVEAKKISDQIELGDEYVPTTNNDDLFTNITNRLTYLKNLNDKYQQTTNTGDLENSLTIAEAYLNSDNTQQGNQILNNLNKLLTQRETELKTKIELIDLALNDITIIEQEINQIDQSKIIKLDLNQELNMVEQSKNMVYLDHTEAVELAEEALNNTNNKSNTQLLMIGGVGVIIMVILVVMLGVGSGIVFVGKKMIDKRNKK